MNTVFIRALQDAADPFVFVASTESVDRYGDVIQQDGWVLANFRKNPIALWMHDHDQPIGVWENVKVEGGKLMAKLALAAQGTSQFIDTLRSLIEQRILRAVSVGFVPLKYEPLVDPKGNPTGGFKFTKQELLEISVVTVPANQEALATARAKGVKSAAIDQVFRPSGTDDLTMRLKSRPPAVPPTSSHKGTQKMTLAERIAAQEAEIKTHKDQLAELTAKDDLTDEDQAQIDELSSKIDAATKKLETLKRAQASLAASASPAGSGTPSAPGQIRSRGTTNPADLMFRSALVVARSYVEKRSPEDIIRRDFNGANDLEVLVRAAVDPAETTVVGWAAELVNATVSGFIDVLRPTSIFFRMPMLSFTFGRNTIKIPGRATVNDLAGGFVGEGAPIPVKRTTLNAVTLVPHKLGVITTMTRELAALSNPAAEPLLRNMMTDDTRETIDGLFLDNNVAVAGIRPAGLQTMATGQDTRQSAGTTLANIITDLRAAIDGMTSRNMGASPVWIMNTSRVLSLQLVTNAAGNFMFRDEIASGRLLGIPLLHSTKVPSSVVFLVDGSEMASASDNFPSIDMSEQATLHMEDTTPLAIGTPGTPATVAAPARSLFQTASLALRLLWDITWVQRRTGSVQTITDVAW